jgi:hypothetical protein
MEENLRTANDLFFSSLHSDIDTLDTLPSDQICLISQVPLEEHFQTLTCGHSFNYIPLYKYIYHCTTQVEYNNTMLTFPYIAFKCPYCREVQHKLIPYIPLEGVSEIYGVNTHKRYIRRKTTCMYVSLTNQRCKSRFLREFSPNTYYCRDHYMIKQHQYSLGPQHVYDTEDSVEVPLIVEPNHGVYTDDDTVVESPNVNTCKYIFVKGKSKNTMCGVSLKGYPSTATTCKKHTKPVVCLPTV